MLTHMELMSNLLSVKVCQHLPFLMSQAFDLAAEQAHDLSRRPTMHWCRDAGCL